MARLVALYSQGHWQQGADWAETLVQNFPHGEVLRNVAGALNARIGRFERAIELYDVALALAPDYFEAFNNRGNALRELGRLEDALESFDAAVKLNPRYAEAHMNRGIVLAALKRHEEALTSYGKAIELNSAIAQAYNNRGNSLQALNRPDDALTDFDTAISLSPALADAFVNRGNTLKALSRLEDALASYDQAIASQPGSAEAWNNRGVTLKFLKRPDEAQQSFEEALAIKPGYAMALAETLYMKAHLCDWSGIAQGETLSQLALAGQVVPPFYMLPVDDEPTHQLAYARHWAKERYGAGRVASFKPRAATSRIKVGYFSADFHNHATMCLMIRLLELHDKSRFELHAFSYGPDSDDPMRKRVIAAVDGFHHVARLSDAEIAALSRAQGIDIAVDLKGFTETSRSGIFSHRPAPVAVNYLGFPSTMGTDFIDYIIADPIIVPEADQRFYAEKVAYLPNSYQVNDRDRAIADKVFTRVELGLPEDGFVSARSTTTTRLRRPSSTSGCASSPRWKAACCGCCRTMNGRRRISSEKQRRGASIRPVSSLPSARPMPSISPANAAPTCSWTHSRSMRTPPPATRCGRAFRSLPSSAGASSHALPAACSMQSICRSW
jgi:protein O-GlcNAc transferase